MRSLHLLATGIVLLATAVNARTDFKLIAVTLDGLTSFDQSGAATTLVTGLGSDNPQYVIFDSIGNMLVTYRHESNGATEVHKFSPTGTDLGTFANTGSSNAPEGLVFDKSGNLYVSLENVGKIEKYSATGQDLGTFVSISPPRDLITDSTGNLFVSGTASHYLEELSPSGTALNSIAYPKLLSPNQIALDSSGNLFVADVGLGEVLKVSLTSPSWTVGVFATMANLAGGLAIDSSDNVYVTRTSGVIEKFSSGGQDQGAFATGLNNPYSLTFAPQPSVASTPEPASLTMLGIGLTGLAGARCRRRRRTDEQ